jgi:hypothetical protein
MKIKVKWLKGSYAGKLHEDDARLLEPAIKSGYAEIYEEKEQDPVIETKEEKFIAENKAEKTQRGRKPKK